jgi:glycosyltransferase involved in cell wall biosynthesis
VVRDGIDGFLVPPHDVDVMASRTLEILADPAKREAMGRAGRERALACFCSNNIIPRYERLYQRVMENA